MPEQMYVLSEIHTNEFTFPTTKPICKISFDNEKARFRMAAKYIY
jgi:NH3-dependent NAD+ synthetase